MATENEQQPDTDVTLEEYVAKLQTFYDLQIALQLKHLREMDEFFQQHITHRPKGLSVKVAVAMINEQMARLEKVVTNASSD